MGWLIFGIIAYILGAWAVYIIDGYFEPDVKDDEDGLIIVSLLWPILVPIVLLFLFPSWARKRAKSLRGKHIKQKDQKDKIRIAKENELANIEATIEAELRSEAVPVRSIRGG